MARMIQEQHLRLCLQDLVLWPLSLDALQAIREQLVNADPGRYGVERALLLGEVNHAISGCLEELEEIDLVQECMEELAAPQEEPFGGVLAGTVWAGEPREAGAPIKALDVAV